MRLPFNLHRDPAHLLLSYARSDDHHHMLSLLRLRVSVTEDPKLLRVRTPQPGAVRGQSQLRVANLWHCTTWGVTIVRRTAAKYWFRHRRFDAFPMLSMWEERRGDWPFLHRMRNPTHCAKNGCDTLLSAVREKDRGEWSLLYRLRTFTRFTCPRQGPANRDFDPRSGLPVGSRAAGGAKPGLFPGGFGHPISDESGLAGSHGLSRGSAWRQHQSNGCGPQEAKG